MQITVRFGLKVFLLALTACGLADAQIPSISSVSPNPMGIGQSVTISGNNFGSSGSVTFSGITATTGAWTSTSISATVPVGATNGNIVVMTSGGNSSAGYPFTLNNGPVNYVYDNLGRLIEVVDVNGNAAEYSYDAVGNILAISRFTSTQVSIAEFSPLSGPVGASVTIYGTGFSGTPSQDMVKFNGTAATVTSASNTQLQVTVPSSASNGPISVTSPNGTATSSTNFTVTASNGLPTITSFTPGSGVAATPVTLTGNNFDPTLANDKLRLNASPTIVTSVTPTTIATTVPGSTSSGRFTLLTPAGTAVSSQDFYLPFGSHVPGDIGYTTRITLPSSATVALSGSSIGLILFDGTEGQHVSIGITNSTLSSCTFYLITPNNSTLTYSSCTAGSGNVDSIYLPASGTYTIGVDPSPSTSGGSVTLSVDSDIVGRISIGGPPVTVTTAYQGQDVRLNFTALAGQRTVAYATNVTNPGATLNIVAPPVNTVIASMPISNNPSGQTFFLDTPPAALLGATYQLWVQHSGTNVGSETLQLVDVSDFTGNLTIPTAGTTGPALRVPSSGNFIAGQNATLSLYGTAGQKLSFNLLNSTIGPGSTSCYLNVYDPNGNSLGFSYCGSGNSGYVDTVTLATSGTYIVRVDPQGTTTGSISISVNNDQDVSTPPITIGGGAVTTTTTVPGQDVRLSFQSNTSGQRIFVTTTNVTVANATLNLVTPAGTTQISQAITNYPAGQTFYLGDQTLATTGAYQLWVHHSSAGYGSETLQIISVPADFGGSLAVPSAGAKGATTRAPSSGNLAVGQGANLTFNGTAGQQLSFNFTSTIGSVAGDASFNLYDPNSNSVAFAYCGNTSGATGFVNTVTLQLTGIYTVHIAPQNAATGAIGVSINNDQDVTTPPITVGGSTVTSQITVAGQDVRLSFTPTTSQPRIAVLVKNVTNPLATVNLWNGTSNQASVSINNNPSGQTFWIDTQPVNANQTYQLWVQHNGTGFGKESMQIGNVPADLSHIVSVNGTTYSFTTVAGQNANIQFKINTSESATVHWTSGTYSNTFGCYMTVIGPLPSTTQVGFANCDTATGSISLGTLSAGTYNILVDPQKQSTGGMSLTVTSP